MMHQKSIQKQDEEEFAQLFISLMLDDRESKSQVERNLGKMSKMKSLCGGMILMHFPCLSFLYKE